ncbi:MAG: hypothetical protein Q9201_004878 [Fulgogasparrea decipioides]
MAPVAVSSTKLHRKSSFKGTASLQTLVLHEICSALDMSPTAIDLNTGFVELGGHSLSALGLASVCKSQGIYLSIEDVLLCNTVAELLDSARWVANPPMDQGMHLSPTRPALKRAAEPALGPLTKRQQRDPRPCMSSASSTAGFQSPMTEMQLVFMQGSQANPGTNTIRFYETYQTKDVPIMERAWKAVMEAESIFRTTFHIEEDKATLIEQMHAPISWKEIIVPNQEDYEKALEENDQALEVFTSFKVVTCQHTALSTIIWRVHHALIDGFSAALLYKKVRRAAAGLPTETGTPFILLARDLQVLQHANQSSCQQFWKQRQEAYPNAVGDLLLPPPTSTAMFRKNATNSITISLPVEQILECARKTKVSAVSIHHAAWAMVLSKYNDSDTVVFGVVLAGRNLPLLGVNDSIGPLVNTLPLHVSLDRSWTTAKFMRHIFKSLVELGSVQYSRPEDGFKRDFYSALATEFEMEALGLDGVRPVGKSCFAAVTDIPLSIFVGSHNTLRLCYHCHSFNKKDIERLGEHYRNALLGLTATDNSLGNCMNNMLTSESCRLLHTIGNCLSNSTTASSVHDDLVTLFERAVSKDPSAVAVEKASEKLTYNQLNLMADRLAKHLVQYIKPGDVVCVNADRSLNWIIAIYGILKAGGIYSPQDKALPAVVRDTNFQSAAAKVFLVSSSSDKKLKPGSCDVCLALDELLSDSCVSRLDVSIRQLPTPSANAYICFTSGSTGKPKGVICTHEGLVAFQRTPEVRLFARPGRKISQIMAPAFDGSIHEIFSALSYGATLVLPDSMDPVSHLRLVDSAILTPSLAQRLTPCDFPRLETLYLVGEPVPQPVNDIWAAQKQLYNMYGPTEGTGGATIKRLLPGKPVTIGVPNPSSRVYILDRNQFLVPPGVAGEIYLAGVQVARGYISRPDETKNRFFPDHIFGKTGEFMYKTGDQGYWNSEGEIICIGRNDRQIKLRGFRLDLNDLEIRMAQAVPALKAVAIARKEDYLVAMVQPSTLDVTDVRTKIAKVLQTHAMPRMIAAVDKFPMTPIGKVDYKEVSNSVNPATKLASKQSTSASEKSLIAAWREALQLGAEVVVDGDSNFADLGGHSLAQLLLASRLSKVFGCQISFSLIASSVTLRDLAQAIDALTGHSIPAAAVRREPMLGELAVSPIEREWWLKYRLKAGSSAFNVSFVCALDRSAVDIERLVIAWNTVMARHCILRCRFVLDHRLGLQRIYSDCAPQARRAYSVDVVREINRPFKLDRSNPIRVTIADDRLVVVISHIICDLTALQILLREAQMVYNGVVLPSIMQTYMETTVWNQTASRENLDFWSKQFENAPACSYGVPNAPARVDYMGSSLLRRVPTDSYKRLTDFATASKFTLHQIALAAVALALHTATNDIDITLGGPYLNRPTAPDLETVGLFLEPLPFRIQYSPPSATASCTSYLRAVQESSRSSLSHAVPWTQLLEHLNIEPSFPNHPLLETMVTFHADPNALHTSLPGLEPLLTWTEGAKFKLLVEFCAVSNKTLLLRLEYDTRIFSPAHIRRIQKLVLEALELLMAETPFVEARKRLQRVDEETVVVDDGAAAAAGSLAVDREVAFGARLSDL